MAPTDLSWEDLITNLPPHFRVARQSPHWLGILVEPAETETPIAVRVERTEMAGSPYLLVLAEVCPTSHLPLWEALSLNLTLVVGAYAIENDRIVLRAVAPLTLNWAVKLVAQIEQLAAEAARQRNARAVVASDSSEVPELFPTD